MDYPGKAHGLKRNDKRNVEGIEDGNQRDDITRNVRVNDEF